MTDRWFALSLAEQLGNVGSEFDRTVKWVRKQQPIFAQNAFDRMLELLDLTVADPRWRNYFRLKELVRLREQVCAGFLDGFKDASSTSGLQKYFMNFAILARSRI